MIHCLKCIDCSESFPAIPTFVVKGAFDMKQKAKFCYTGIGETANRFKFIINSVPVLFWTWKTNELLTDLNQYRDDARYVSPGWTFDNSERIWRIKNIYRVCEIMESNSSSPSNTQMKITTDWRVRWAPACGHEINDLVRACLGTYRLIYEPGLAAGLINLWNRKLTYSDGESL